MTKLLPLRIFLFCSLAATLAMPTVHAQQKPWPIKIVIVTTFERGEDTGDVPGEFQFWVEREHLDEKLPFPGGVHPLRTNVDHSVLGMVSGTTLVNAGASIMALGLDPRFDLTHAYWLMNGIAGVDPADASIGSAAWASYVVNDVAREIDPREAPTVWPYGIFAIGTDGPDKLPDQPLMVNDRINVYALNAPLAEWAFELTRNLKLKDTPEMQAVREAWKGFPNAQRPPFVLEGDTFASDYYWHGKIMTQYANDWVKLWTAGKGNFVMTEMEDSAVASPVSPRRHASRRLPAPNGPADRQQLLHARPWPHRRRKRNRALRRLHPRARIRLRCRQHCNSRPCSKLATVRRAASGCRGIAVVRDACNVGLQPSICGH